MNNNYRYILMSKLYKLRGLYIRQSTKTSEVKEQRLYNLHVPKVTEFYERNKSRELLDYFLKNKNYLNINTLLTQAEHIAKQSSKQRRKLIAKACLRGLGNDYTALYVVSNQKTTKELKELIKIYFSDDENKEEIFLEAKKKILSREIHFY